MSTESGLVEGFDVGFVYTARWINVVIVLDRGTGTTHDCQGDALFETH